MRAFTLRFAVRASRCLTVLLAFGLVLGTATAASAQEVNVAVERPTMYFAFAPGTYSLTVCGNGFLSEPPSPNPVWTLDVYGTRSGGTLITGSDFDFSQNGFVCVTTDKLFDPEGTYTAVFRFQALPSDPPSQVVAHIAWFPGTDGEIVVTEQ
jgi:hypothetical protein